MAFHEESEKGMKTIDSDRGSEVRGRRPAVAALILAAACCLVPAVTASAQEESGGRAEATRTALEKWVETRRLISKEKRDWRLGREVLNDRIELVKQEMESLRARIAEARKSIADAEEKRGALVEKKAVLERTATELAERVGSIEARTVELLPKLPEPIRERVERLSQKIPENPQETKLTTGERFQFVIGILNEVNKFNAEVTVTNEVRTLSDGRSAEVDVLYFGIGHAYYASAKADAAGIGTESGGKWVWIPADESAPQIAKAIAILRDGEMADFVQLPLRIGRRR